MISDNDGGRRGPGSVRSRSTSPGRSKGRGGGRRSPPPPVSTAEAGLSGYGGHDNASPGSAGGGAGGGMMFENMTQRMMERYRETEELLRATRQAV